MPAHVEMVMGIIRQSPTFKEFGDPYTFSASVIVRKGIAEIVGGSGEFNMAALRDIRDKLFENSEIKEIRWERRQSDGEIKEVIITRQKQKHQTR